MQVLGFLPQAIAIMANFLADRKQFVQVQAHRSDKLAMGPNSVIQGSTLSCALFLIYIMDMPLIFHDTPHTPQQYRDCPQPHIKTYVDDGYIKTYTKPNHTIKESIQETMDKMHDYTKANKLALNQDKTIIMLQTQDQAYKDNFTIELSRKHITHQPEVKILGNLLSETLTWDSHVAKVLVPSLTNRIRTLRLTTKYLRPGFRAQYTNAIFRSKLMFGIETWRGALKNKIAQIQRLQDQATKLALPTAYHKHTPRQRHHVLNWFTIDKEITTSTLTFTHKVLNKGSPQEIATQMPPNTSSLRLIEHNKLGTKPRWLNANKVTRASYRSRAYFYNTLPGTLTSIKDHKKFKTKLKQHLMTTQ